MKLSFQKSSAVILLSIFLTVLPLPAYSFFIHPVVVEAGKILGVAFAEGFAGRMGEGAASYLLETFLKKYPPPKDVGEDTSYVTPNNELVRYEFEGWKNNKPVYIVIYSGRDFWCEDPALNNMSKYRLGCPGY